MKKVLHSILISIIFLFIFQLRVNAETIVLNVNNQEEFGAAFSTINSSTNGDFTINVKNDITIDTVSFFPNKCVIDNNNNVTILGNNHTLKFLINSVGYKLNVKNGTLNLGKSDGSDKLIIDGGGDELTDDENVKYPTFVSLVTMGDFTNSSILNMYEGVKLTNNSSGSSAGLSGGAVHVGNYATFNMFGGEISHIDCLNSQVCGTVLVDGNDATFNMQGGIISNNRGVWYGAGVTAYGIESTNVKVNITCGTITNNESDFGGGISNLGADINVENATITNNKAVYGGGILVYYGKCTSKNNSIKENEATNIGGGIYVANSTLKSENDEITANEATSGAGIYVDGGTEADFSSTKVYNNLASDYASDYFIDSDVISISIMDASEFDEDITIDEKSMPIDGWYTDIENDRYSLTNYTSKVELESISVGNEYSLIAASNSFGVSYDDDGKSNTDNVVKRVAKGKKIKINPNGGEYSVQEIEVTNDVEIDAPTRDLYRFTGWSVEELEGYEFVLKANWEERKEYTVTFKVVNGKWNDDTITDITLKIREDLEGVAKLPFSSFPNGMTANDGFEDGYWDPYVTEDVVLTKNEVYTYKFTKKEEYKKYTVTFKIVNGKWSDNTSEDKTITIEENSDHIAVLNESDFPTGMIANEGYENGSWDKAIKEFIEVDGDQTYTYSFVEKEKENNKYTVTFKVINGTWVDGTTEDKTLIIEANKDGVAKLKLSDVPVGMKPNKNYKNGSWDKIANKDILLQDDATYTYVFEKDKNESTEDDSSKEIPSSKDDEEPELPKKEETKIDDTKNDGKKTEEEKTTNNIEKETETTSNVVVEDKTEEINDNDSEEKSTKNTDNSKNPKTGDNILIFVIILTLSTFKLVRVNNAKINNSKKRRKPRIGNYK